MEQESLPLEDYIARRRTQLADEEARLREKLKVVVEERVKLDKAAMAAGLLEEPYTATKGTLRIDLGSPPQTNRRRSRTRAKIAMKDAIMQVLEETGHGLPASEILPRVNALLGVQFARSSLSPQLSRLKNSGELILDGKNWCLPKKDEQGNAERERDNEIERMLE